MAARAHNYMNRLPDGQTAGRRARLCENVGDRHAPARRGVADFQNVPLAERDRRRALSVDAHSSTARIRQDRRRSRVEPVLCLLIYFGVSVAGGYDLYRHVGREGDKAVRVPYLGEPLGADESRVRRADAVVVGC